MLASLLLPLLIVDWHIHRIWTYFFHLYHIFLFSRASIICIVFRASKKEEAYETQLEILKTSFNATRISSISKESVNSEFENFEFQLLDLKEKVKKYDQEFKLYLDE